MELDQLIFKKIINLAKKITRQDEDKILPQTVTLSSCKNSLTILARSLTGIPIEIVETESVGCWKNKLFFLPGIYQQFDNYRDNYNYFLFRTVALSAQLKLNLNFSDNDHAESDGLTAAQNSFQLVLNEIQKSYPNVFAIYLQLKEVEEKRNEKDNFPLKYLHGKWMFNDNISDNNFLNENEVVHWENNSEDKDNTVELDKGVQEEVEILTVDTEQQENYVMTHNFEKVDTIEDFNGNWRDFDAEEDLEENQEALQELEHNYMVRVNSPSHSIYKTEFFNSGGIAESNEKANNDFHLLYDEWDYKAKSYRKNYCKVFIGQHKDTDAIYTSNTLKNNAALLLQLKRKLNNFFNQFTNHKKQVDGEEPDLDAIVDRFADIYSGKTPSDNIYIAKRKKVKDVSILILMDVSLSTDGYANNQRIIDVEKQSLILFGEVLSEYGADFQVDTFSSHTRNHCVYTTVKSFNEEWNTAKHKIGAIQPEGYTRIGPAIRHATSVLNKSDAKKKWIILLTDGKPNDYDRYEGTHGIEDVKDAIRKTRTQDIHITSLAIDENAKYYLPVMFGEGSFTILQHPKFLPDALAKFYLNVIK